jgi:hypothetical protein
MDAQDRIIFAQTGGGKRIGTARDTIAPIKAGLPLLEWQRRTAHSQAFPFDERAAGSVPAEINHGRWMVRCPACPGAEEADPEQPIFYCLSCGNADNGGHVMAVEFPKDREEIERLLLAREIENRNVKPTETPADIEAENLEYGVIDLRDGVSDEEAALAGRALQARRD